MRLEGEGIPAIGRYSFDKREKLAKKGEIDAVFATGKSYSRRGLKLMVLKTETESLRAVFIPVRAYPDSVRRNRARRLVSEAFRLFKPECATGFDLVFVLYPGKDTFESRRSQVFQLLTEAGIMRGTEC